MSNNNTVQKPPLPSIHVSPTTSPTTPTDKDNNNTTATTTTTTKNGATTHMTSPRLSYGSSSSGSLLVQQMEQLLMQKTHQEQESNQKLAAKISRQNDTIIQLQKENLELQNQNFFLNKKLDEKQRELEKVQKEFRDDRLLIYHHLLLSCKIESDTVKKTSTTVEQLHKKQKSSGEVSSAADAQEHAIELDLTELAQLALEQNVPLKQVRDWYLAKTGQ